MVKFKISQSKPINGLRFQEIAARCRHYRRRTLAAFSASGLAQMQRDAEVQHRACAARRKASRAALTAAQGAGPSQETGLTLRAAQL